VAVPFSRVCSAVSEEKPAWCARNGGAALNRRWRPRRPLPGMLLHLDGSSHAWLGEDRRYDLLVVLDECLRTAFGLATHKGFAS
jgi:hypothetical protein